MESDRFDQITRSLSAAPSRRRVFQLATTGVLALVGWNTEIAAKRKKKKKKCKSPKVKCGKRCCAAGQECTDGQCRTAGCSKDSDCRDETQSCQQGRCQAICPTGACPGCVSCVVGLREGGKREQICAGIVVRPIPSQACNSDADCGGIAPECVIQNPNQPCTNRPCGTCVIDTGFCGECEFDIDCPDRTEECSSNECQPICSQDACPNACTCAVEYPTAGDRRRLCAGSVSLPPEPKPCSTTQECSPTETCLRFSQASCVIEPCGECALGFTPCQ